MISERSRMKAVWVLLLLVGLPSQTSAQQSTQFEAGGHIAWSISSEFENGDIGFGGRFAWRPGAVLGIEAELTRYPEEFPDERPRFSRARTEGLFGVTLGPARDRLRPFVRVRPGFLTFHGTDEPFACIAIFPPPLACALAAGRTVFALDLGGGIQAFTSSRTFLRVDLGDRLVRLPGPVFDSQRNVRDGAFFTHDFRFTAGGGLRF
jgi:hypothetical protein